MEELVFHLTRYDRSLEPAARAIAKNKMDILDIQISVISGSIWSMSTTSKNGQRRGGRLYSNWLRS